MAELNGRHVELELVELSFGCSYHDSPTCLLVRVKDTGELLHLPEPAPEVQPRPPERERGLDA